MTVTISDKGREILALCERKIELQREAEELNDRAHSLIVMLKEISDRQSSVLHHMQAIDDSIERLAQTC